MLSSIAVPGLTTSFTTIESYAQAPIDISYDVQLVPQLTGMSCWAAGVGHACRLEG